MRPQLVFAALLLTACTTSVRVRGRYATALSGQDVQEIRRLAHRSPHFGHTLITLDAVRRDRIRVQTKEYDGDRTGWSGTTMYVIRHQAGWQIDEKSPLSAEAERTITVY